MNKIQAILFDCDGVLLDSERKIKELIHKYMINNYNCDISYDYFYTNTRGMSLKNTVKFLNNNNITITDNFIEYFDELYSEINYTPFTTKIIDIEETLKILNDFPKAVCSNGETFVYKPALKHHGIEHYFDDFFGLDNVEKSKPAPDMFLKAAKSLDIPIENCLIIDDSHFSGIPAGKACNAGAVVGFASDSFVSHQQMLDAGADYVITSLKELPIIINKINNG
jgi:HAD superfamily hydrolase (TIGR01509 family)